MTLNTASPLTSKVIEAGTPIGTRELTSGPGDGRTCLSADYYKRCWYVAYTCGNHEKRVAEQLAVQDVEYFLPTYVSVRRWKDRRVTLQLPLFPGYVFVHIPLSHRMQVLQVPGVAHLVGFGGVPTPVQDEEIEALQTSLVDGVRVEPYPFLTVGRRVRVKAGPLTGVEGILLRRKGNLRLVVSIQLIQRSIILDIEATNVETLNDSSPKVLSCG